VYVLLLVAMVATVAVLEVGYVTVPSAGAMVVISAFCVLLFSIIKKVDKVTTEDESIAVGGLGFKAEAHGPKLLTGGMGGNLVLFSMIVGIALLGYKHHLDSELQLTKIFEAMAENTYVLSLTPQEREKLNIAMPESLRKKLRNHQDANR